VKEHLEEYQDGVAWKLEEGGVLTLGITENGLNTAGDVMEVELADAGDEFEAGDWIGEIRGKNSLVEIFAPCSLRVSERNEELLSQPAMVEDDPTGDAWMLRAEKLDG
jgi:glycine cleavage system H protein